LLAWGVGWWVWTVVEQIAFRVDGMASAANPVWFAPYLRVEDLILLALALSAALWAAVARAVRWSSLAFACLVPLPVAALVLAGRGLGWLPLAATVWGVFFVAHLLDLRLLRALLPATLQKAAHVLGAWLLVGVLMLAARNALLPLDAIWAGSAWPWLGWALAPSVYLWLASSDRGRFWPLGDFSRQYRYHAALPMAAGMLAWFWVANALSPGNAQPLPYLPILNPLELGLLLVLLACWHWGRAHLPVNARAARIVVGVSLLAFVTVAVCRVATWWLGVPFHPDDMFASMAVQAGWSQVWTLYALVLMVGGNRTRLRGAWVAGAALIAVVVVKLIFVELRDSGSLARIVSFIGVGLLLLIVGYFSPLPPKPEATRQGEKQS